ncbi:hypothetical protein T484DRAFT_1938911 [Baffinella frigidus]|nr:hypothetical protein T484DRAFT_1938911 [Cryptophyta sp. CCMP2293]
MVVLGGGVVSYERGTPVAATLRPPCLLITVDSQGDTEEATFLTRRCTPLQPFKGSYALRLTFLPSTGVPRS